MYSHGAKFRSGRRSALTLVSLLAMSWSGVAAAQTATPDQPAALAEASGDDNTIVVTASRVARGGFDAPTPTTVIGATELRQGARANVAAVLNDLPNFRATLNPGNTGLSAIKSGVQAADLRGLGEARTLVLLNGHRFVGDNDLNTIPVDLVKRIEVVTGGASASWGSGAVAGVINVILDDEFDGLALSGRTGISSRGDGFEYRVGGAAGMRFAGDRGHVMLSAEFYDSEGITPRTSRPLIGDAGLLGSTLVTNLSATNFSQGGLITSGVLAGRTFNPDGSLRAFNVGSSAGATLSIGGEQSSGEAYNYLNAPVKRINLFGRSTFDITDGIALFGDLRFMRMNNNYLFSPDRATGSQISININNAFLPLAVRTAMANAGQTSFTMGRLNNDFGFRRFKYSREDIQGVIGAKGDLGEAWNWEAFYTHGERTIQQEVFNARIIANFNQAVDSVISPTTNQPICRVALTNPTTNCVPINLFGFGTPLQNAAAVDFVNGEAFLRYRQYLDVGAVTLRGDPFSTWAGPVSFAVGGEVRHEKIRTLGNDAISLANGFTTINSKGYDGSFSVKEAFGEVVVPLLKDVPFFDKLDFNAAARVSDYSNTGTIWAWKVGVTNRISDDLRLRLVRSRDTRSANLVELYTKQTSSTSTITDTRFTPTRQYQVTAFGGGNAALQPEESDTFSVGAVFTPSFVPGLSLSIDYYDIDIDGAIATLTAQDIVTRCNNGTNTALCTLVTRDATNTITSIQSTFINLSNYHTRGLDFELAYQLPLARIAANVDGSLRFRALATYVDLLRSNDGVRVTDSIGVVGPGQTFGVPQWRGTGSLTYQNGGTSIDFRARYIGPGTYNPALAITNNRIGAQTYFDLTFDIGVPVGGKDAFSLFGSVTNLFDRDPPVAANPQFYDIVGRYLSFGARVRF